MKVKSIQSGPAYFDFRPSGRGRTLESGQEADIANSIENYEYVRRMVESNRLQVTEAPEDFSDLPDNPVVVSSNTTLADSVSCVLCDASAGSFALVLPNLLHRTTAFELMLIRTDTTFNVVTLTPVSGQTVNITKLGIPGGRLRLFPSGTTWLAHLD